MHNILDRITEHRDRLYFIGLIALSSFCLSYAFFVEYVLGFDPCVLCLYQRIPYYLLIITGISGIVFKNHKYHLYMALMIFWGATILSGYHTAIENGLLDPTETCNPGFNIPEGASADEVRAMLYDAPIASCTKAAFKIFGISMTEWNLMLNFCLFVATILVIRQSKSSAQIISSKITSS